MEFYKDKKNTHAHLWAVVVRRQNGQSTWQKENSRSGKGKMSHVRMSLMK